jgi:hypothetical protein
MPSNGLFISQRDFLAKGGGGVQLCTREFVDVITAADVALTVLPFAADRRLSTRLLRAVNSSPFVRPFGPDLVPQIRRLAGETRFDFVFLNQEALSSLAPLIRPFLPRSCRIVVLSHGLEHTDLIHMARLRGRLPITSRLRPTAALALGNILLAEQRHRPALDGVCAISPFDADLERWLGTRHVTWLPRLLTPRPLAWQPVPGRMGFVGTLDHAPNLEGLVDILEVMGREATPDLTVRIVGSAGIGRWLEAKYKHAEFTGELNDAALLQEAASWTAFIHPIFCLPRGASTKLATGLSWQIPAVTTAFGRRGYVWSEGRALEADTPEAFVAACRSLDPATAQKVRQDVIRAVESSPTLETVAARMRDFLASL